MADLRIQLRSYVEATVERVDAADVIARGAGVVALEQPRGWRRPALVAVAAAAATLVLAAGVTLLALWLTRSEAPVATTLPPTTTLAPPSTTSTTTTTTTTTTSTTVPGLDPASAAAWGAADLVLPEEETPPFRGGGHIVNDIAAGDALVVAVGDAMNEDENAMRDGLIWVSTDGRIWQRALDPDDLDFGGRGLNAVVAAGPGFIAGGSACDTEERCTAGWRAALWTSVDGHDWQRVTHDTALFGERSAIEGLFAYSGGTLALGLVCDDSGCQSVIWSSLDGLTWERIWASESIWPASIAASATTLVGVGSIGTDTGSHAAVWTSIDGTEWEQVPHDPEVFGDGEGTETSMVDVAAGTDGFVAVGIEGTDAVIWFSADGVTWERIPDTAGSLVEASIYGVSAWDDGFLAVGPDWAITEELGGPVPGLPFIPSRPTIWVSPDGRNWHPIGIGEPDAVGAVRAVTRFRDVLIAVGQDGPFMEGRDAIWVNEQPPALDR